MNAGMQACMRTGFHDETLTNSSLSLYFYMVHPLVARRANATFHTHDGHDLVEQYAYGIGIYHFC
jgi:hypothetical protein